MKQHSLKNNSFWDALYGQEKNCLLLLMALSFVAIFFQLGTRSLENQCYIRYAEVAREMLRSGDWIVPHINGELYTHKPALVIWLIALPSALAGKVTPLLARLPSAISALAIIGLTYFLGKRMFRDFRVGAFAGFILLSSKEFFWQAKAARVDMVFTLFLLFSLVCFYEAFLSSGKKRFSLFIFFFVGMALGTLTKGPAIILFYLGSVAVFLFFKKRLRVLMESGFWWGWVVFVLILLSWVLPYISRVPWAAFKEKFILAEVFSRPEPFYYYVVEFWIRFAPWSLFVPITVLFFFRKKPDQRDERLFLLSWIGVILVPLLLLHNKSYRYLLPIFPAYSIILGAAFKEGLLSWVPNQHDWLTRFWKYPSYFYLYALLIAFLPGPFLAWWFTRDVTAVAVSAVVSFMGIFLVVYSIRKGKALVQFVVIGFVTLMCFETYFYFIAREDKMHSPVMELAANIQSRVAPEELCYFDPGGHIKILLNFYLDTVIPNLGSPSEVLAFFNQPGKSRACFMSEQGFSQIFQTVSHKGFEVFPLRYDKKETYLLVIAKKE